METNNILRQMVQPERDEPEWLDGQKIGIQDIAVALQCSPQLLYILAREGKCPFISAAKPEDNKKATYIVWPGLAEVYIGKERLRAAVEGRDKI